MIFKHVNKIVEPLSLKIENTDIERVTNFNFLGLTISDNLEWKTHVQKIANKCSRTTGILNKLKHILPASISLMLYKSLLLPQLNYCIFAWGHNCKRLIKLQKKALRIISISKYNAPTDPLCKKYRILKLPHILQLQQLKLYHKYINKKLPAYLQNIPLKQNKSFHEHLTRSHLKLHITRTNHRFAERCIRNSIPLLVNTTPMEILTTNLAAVVCVCVCVCVCAKFDQFLPTRSYFESIRPENLVRIAKFPYAAFGPLFAFHCPLFFTRKDDL